MTPALPDGQSRAARMRQAFDASLAVPPVSADRDAESVLTVRVAGDPYAMRLREIAAIAGGLTVTAVPSSAPGLLGLAGMRGNIVPVFSLAALLGYSEPANPPLWMVLSAGAEPVGLAFDVFERYVLVPQAALRACSPGSVMRGLPRSSPRAAS